MARIFESGPAATRAGGPARRAGGRMRTAAIALCLAGLLLCAARCGFEGANDRPNILFVCWDTVRADRLGLYGCTLPTTPFVDRWAAEARVFDDCLSVANCTVPAHASWFTGFMPGEHGRNNNDALLDNRFDTLAEYLQRAGCATYMFSANPHIARENKFDQGFDRAEFPWDEKYRRAAAEITRSKRSTGKGSRPRLRESKDSGTLPREGLIEWLGTLDGQKPFFAFINVMEAHLPCAPAAEYLERVAGGTERFPAERRAGIAWADIWRYTLGELDLTDAQLEWNRMKYAGCVAELDALFEDLLTSLEEAGHLENTVVILTADHGEHLGEHHMLDHQYSLHEPLIKVPLVIHGRGRFTAGRDRRPVTNADLFPTLLELAGVEPPGERADKAISLLRPVEERIRVAECPAFPIHWFNMVKNHHPYFDPAPYARTLRAVYRDDFKLIAGSDDRFGLYDLAADPGESNDLSAQRPDLLEEMRGLLRRWTRSFDKIDLGAGKRWEMSPDERRRLRALGYPAGG